MDLREIYWGGGVEAAKVLKLTNGTSNGGLAISSRCWPTTYATVQKMEVPTLNALETENVVM